MTNDYLARFGCGKHAAELLKNWIAAGCPDDASATELAEAAAHLIGTISKPDATQHLSQTIIADSTASDAELSETEKAKKWMRKAVER